MGPDGQEGLQGGEHGEAGHEADHLDGEEGDGDAQPGRQLRVLPGEVQLGVVQREAGQHVVLSAHEDGQGEDEVRDECEEPGQIRV